MGNKFYVPGEERSGKVNDLFATIAPRYDLINDLQSFGVHRWWKRRLVGLAALPAGERLLDLCCGTGDVAQAGARTGVRVCGLDFSGPMLEVARRRGLANTGGRGPAWLRGDALRLPFADGVFGAVTISYGLRNLADIDAGIQEMLRVLRPDGRLLVLDFAKPRNRVLRWAYFQYLRRLVPVFGRWFCGDPATHAYIYESLLHYPDQEALAGRLRKQGCRDVRVINLVGGCMSIHVATKGGRHGA